MVTNVTSVTACVAAKKMPPPGWTKLDEDVNSVFAPKTRELKPGALPLPGEWTPPDKAGLGARHMIGNPVQVYPLYENSLRAHRNRSFADNHRESVQMYGEFAQVAKNNQYAWNYGKAESEEGIGTVTKRNRMICIPCELSAPQNMNNRYWLTRKDPLLMNAFNTINLAGACILTSTEYAREIGIPSDRWIYALGGAGTKDSDDCECSSHASLTHSVILILCSLGKAGILVEPLHFSVVRRRPRGFRT